MSAPMTQEACTQATAGSREAPRSHAKGEVTGAFLLGLLHSFRNLNVLPASESLRRFGTISASEWYPYCQLMDLLQEIHAEVPRTGAILFRAGIHFIRLWYEQGPGRSMVRSGRDWLYANQHSGGYNSVVRGGSKEEIGWCDIQRIDEEAGIVVYENVTPLPPEYVRGVFQGGCLLFEDMDYVEVDVDAEPYGPNPDLLRTFVTVRFRYRPKGPSLDLDGLLAGTRPDDLQALGHEDIQRLLWRHRFKILQQGQDAHYFDELGQLLASANRKSLELTRTLSAKVEALNAALHRVRSMEGLLPVCAWCKRMREDDARWVSLEEFVGARTSASFTHTICPECAKQWK